MTTFGQAEAAGGDAAVGARDRARDLLRRDDQLRRRRASRSTASRPTRARSRGTGTTAWSSPGTSRRRRFGVSTDRPPVAAADVRAVPAARGDLRARAVAPEGVPRAACSRSRRTTGSATRASCRSCTRSTAMTAGRDRDDGRGRRDRGALPGRLRPPRAAGSRSTPCPRTRCSTSRPAPHGEALQAAIGGLVPGSLATGVRPAATARPLSAD